MEQRRERVKLTESTKRILWAESAGYCENPSCNSNLFFGNNNHDIAEMAHIIPASTGGPRDVPVAEISLTERSRPENIVILCANCHTLADKAPREFPAEMMRQWKALRRRQLDSSIGVPNLQSRGELWSTIEPLLAENKMVFTQYGPTPDSSRTRAEAWANNVAKVIIPNNHRIAALLRVNRGLLSDVEKNTADAFNLHQRQLRDRHLAGDWTPGSLTFPESMNEILIEERQ